MTFLRLAQLSDVDSEAIELLRSREVGTTARLTFKGVGSVGDVDLDVAVEQMLPDYQ